jgi:hypothetical protein
LFVVVREGINRVKLVKLLTIPSVLLLVLLMALPASAKGLSKATIGLGCGPGAQSGQVCVTLNGDLEDLQNLHRFLFFKLYAHGSTTVLDTITFDVTTTQAGDVPFKATMCFKAIPASVATTFDVQIFKVTSDAAGTMPSDFQFLAAGSQNPFIDFDGQHSKPVQINSPDKPVGPCVAPPSPSAPASPPAPMSSPTPTPPALAQTGGFDYRWPIAGLALVVAGLGLFVFASVRRRSPNIGS